MNGPAVPIEEALAAVGDLLRAANERVAIVVVGGATLPASIMEMVEHVRRSRR